MVIRFLPIVLFLAFLTGCSATTSTIPAAESDAQVQSIQTAYPPLRNAPWTSAVVERVVDGDTFETTDGLKVRLIGVNTPEITNGKSEAYGQEAKNFTQAKLVGQTIYMFQDAGPKDKYGRLLRYVFIHSEPIMFNELLVAEGYANTMTIPPNVLYAESFAAIERKARSQNKGLWGATAAPHSPAAVQDASCKSPQIKGNINTKGDKIYHLPGGKSYELTKAEAKFCTEKEAEAAGFRKAAQ